LKVLENWKQKETVYETNLSKAKFEKDNFQTNETRYKMVFNKKKILKKNSFLNKK